MDGKSHNPRVFDSRQPVTEKDIRALHEFLDGPWISDEKKLQKLLEQHPALVGPLGFVEFVSEFPIYKVNTENTVDLMDLRRRDRADLIAATQSPIQPSYKSANLIELKSAGLNIADRNVGFRLS